MMPKSLMLWVLGLLPAFLCAQHDLSLELGGKSLLWGSLNYEYHLGQSPFGIGASLGLSHMEFSQVDPLPGPYRYNEVIFPNSFFASGTWGATHRFHANLGLTLQYTIIRTRPQLDPSIDEFSVLAAPFVGAGYEWRGERWFFRAMAYGLYLGRRNSGIFPALLPWGGLSLGRSLNP